MSNNEITSEVGSGGVRVRSIRVSAFETVPYCVLETLGSNRYFDKLIKSPHPKDIPIPFFVDVSEEGKDDRKEIGSRRG